MKLDMVWPDLRVLARSSPTDKYVLVEGIILSKVTICFRIYIHIRTTDKTNKFDRSLVFLSCIAN